MLLLIIVMLVFASVLLVFAGSMGRERAPSMEARIQDFRARAGAEVEDEIDLNVPFAERVIKPGVEGLARAVSSILPASVLSDIQKQLVMSGAPMKLNTYVTFWVASFASLSGLGLLMFVALPADLLLQKLAMVFIFTLIGWIFPRMWLKGKVKARQKLVTKALPDALDLITTCVEAGLGLDAALARVAEKSEGPFAVELTHMLRDVAMGKLRRDALTELGERIGVEELTNFISSIIQAEQLGVGIAQVLRVQSDQMRMRRRQRAEKTAHEAPIKMIFPLVLFIFPAFLMVILGPAMIRISTSLL
ncbi:MAG: type II secretion system F family protein [Chloroflexi bacterium]|nr:type II secretion system F family protein [Chloroflexota bacterium]